MYSHTENLDGGLGGGYLYQWASALYVGSIICSRRHDANFEHPFLEFLSETFNIHTDLTIRFEGSDPECEDFEIQCARDDTGHTKGRILFQVKTFSTEKSSTISLADRTIVAALRRLTNTLIMESAQHRLKAVLILNAPVSSAPRLSRFRPTPLSAIGHHKLIPVIKKLPYTETQLEQCFPFIYIWQLPEFDFLFDYLWLFTGMETINAKAILTEAGIASAIKHGSIMPISALCRKIQQRADTNTTRRKAEQELTQSFILDYTINNPLPNNDITSYLKFCYVTRKDNVELDEISKKIFFLRDAVAFYDEAIQWTKNIGPPPLQPNNLRIWNDKLAGLKSLITGFDAYGLNKHIFLDDYSSAWESLRGFFLDHIRKDIEISSKIAKHQRALRDAAPESRNIVLIVGKAGSGKTLTALRFAEGYEADWKLYLNLTGRTANLETITKCFASSMNLPASPYLFAYLRTKMGKGLVLVDGLDESDELDDSILLSLLKSLARVLPYDCIVLLTCRTDYVHAFTSPSNHSSESAPLLTFINEQACLIQVPRIDDKDPASWLSKLSNCYGIPQERAGRLAYLVGRRYTPREINWLMNTIQQDLVSDIGHEIKRLGDFVALYYSKVITDQQKRQRSHHKSSAILEENILAVAKVYWEQAAIDSSDLSQNGLKLKLPPEAHGLLDSLIASNELILDKKNLVWRLADFGFYCVAISLLKECSGRTDRETIEQLLAVVYQRYKHYACDILVIAFYHFLQRAYISVLQERIGLDYEADPEEEYLTNEEKDSYLIRLSEWVVESEYGYGIIALQILRFLDGEEVLDMDNLPSDRALDENSISFDRVVEYVDSLVESYGLDRSRRTRKSIWYFNHFVHTCKAIESSYPTNALVNLDETGLRLCQLVLIDANTSLQVEAELFGHLGALPHYLGGTGEKLKQWITKKILSIQNIDELASLLVRLGNYAHNESRGDIAYEISEGMCNHGEIDAWLVEKVDHPIFSVPHFYVRKSLFNVYVGSRRFSAGEAVLDNLLRVLRAGGREARRNAIFVIHEWHIKDNNKKTEKLLDLLFNEMEGASDLELVSTIFGVIEVNKLTRRREVAGGRTALQAMEETGFLKYIKNTVEDDLSRLTTKEDVVHRAVDLRGLIEYIEEVRYYFDCALGRVNGDISDNTRRILIGIQMEEAGDMPEFFNMLNHHDSVLQLGRFRVKDDEHLTL